MRGMRRASSGRGAEMIKVKVKEQRNAAIRRGLDVLTGPAIGLSARKACLQLAQGHGVCVRHVWRILKAAP